MRESNLTPDGKKAATDETKDTAAENAKDSGRSRDEVALELMKFIAVTTGYGKGSNAGAGFSGKPSSRTPEEYADALIQLFEKCRSVVAKPGADQ